MNLSTACTGLILSGHNQFHSQNGLGLEQGSEVYQLRHEEI